jgi:hypothetical protein
MFTTTLCDLRGRLTRRNGRGALVPSNSSLAVTIWALRFCLRESDLASKWPETFIHEVGSLSVT